MRLYISLILIVCNTNVFSQKLDIRFDEECHNENSEILLDVMEDALGEKRVKKIVKKGYKIEFIDPDINIFKYQREFTVSATFDVLGTIKEVEFNAYDNLLTKRDKKKIRNYILENQIPFNICWYNMYELKKRLNAGTDINTIREAFYISLYRNDLGNSRYTLYIEFPGFITQEFYDKYLKDLKYEN